MRSVDGIEIRPAHTLPSEIHCLADRALGEGFAFVHRLVREWEAGRNRFDRPGEVFLAARSGEALVGFGGLNLDPYDPRPSIGRVRHLYTAAAARGNGVGRALVLELIRRAAPTFSTLRLSTDQAGPFYQKLGFAQVSEPHATHILQPIPELRSDDQLQQRTVSHSGEGVE